MLLAVETSAFSSANITSPITTETIQSTQMYTTTDIDEEITQDNIINILFSIDFISKNVTNKKLQTILMELIEGDLIEEIEIQSNSKVDSIKADITLID